LIAGGTSGGEPGTDRAFRIGQTKHVLVHKFVCPRHRRRKDRCPHRIQAAAGQRSAGGGGEINLTELDDTQLLKLVALDINAALKE